MTPETIKPSNAKFKNILTIKGLAKPKI